MTQRPRAGRLLTLAVLALAAAIVVLALPSLVAQSVRVPSSLPAALSGCPTSRASTLPQIRIDFPEQPCRYTLAEVARGVTLSYAVVVTAPVEGVQFWPQDAGRCGSRDGGGLQPLAQVLGNGQYYGIKDTGRCQDPTAGTIRIEPGVYSGKLPWDGVNWSGPSDTFQPKGGPFPPGSYQFLVTIRGYRPELRQPEVISAALTIQLVLP